MFYVHSDKDRAPGDAWWRGDPDGQFAANRGGVVFGIYRFGQKISGGLAGLIAGALVDRFAGLVPAQAEQFATTVDRLAMTSNLLPASSLCGMA